MLGDDSQYPIKGIGESSYKLGSRNPMKIKYVMYVPGLKKKLLYISYLDKKDLKISFIDGRVLMWTKGKNINNPVEIVVEEA